MKGSVVEKVLAFPRTYLHEPDEGVDPAFPGEHTQLPLQGGRYYNRIMQSLNLPRRTRFFSLFERAQWAHAPITRFVTHRPDRIARVMSVYSGTPVPGARLGIMSPPLPIDRIKPSRPSALSPQCPAPRPGPFPGHRRRDVDRCTSARRERGYLDRRRAGVHSNVDARRTRSHSPRADGGAAESGLGDGGGHFEGWRWERRRRLRGSDPQSQLF